MTFLRSPSLRIVVLLFQTAWLNAVVPGHRRGIVSLPGDDSPTCHSEGSGCCPEMADEAPARSKSPPSKDPVSHCAICHFAAALFAAPPVDLSPPAHEYLEPVDSVLMQRAKAVAFRSPYYGRAPPAYSFHLV